MKLLPNTITFATLRAFLPDRLASLNDADVGSFILITNEVMDLEVAFRNSTTSYSSNTRLPGCSSSTSQLPAPPPLQPLVPTVSSTIVPPSTQPVKQPLTCNNCKDCGLWSTGHTDGTCFQLGGGMEGCREEYMNNKSRIHAMFAECLENAYSIPDQDIQPQHSPLVSPHIPPVLDSELILPHVANLCVTSTTLNSDFHDDLYIPHVFEIPHPFAFASVNFSATALISLVNIYNTILDSGCTHHIIQNCDLFHTYVA